MKMLIVIGPHSRERDIRDALGRHGAKAFTEVPEVMGAGATGAHFGTPAFPGRQTLIFSVLTEEQLASALAGLTALRGQLYPDERLHAFTVPAEAVL
ncbi:MAG: hypothetical protein NZ740_07000 [Kiritimatiellae bacterium]|nr:hypothetical protein [Kiritimatiellia bacterium]MDW8458845.1 hypothetical protein [Verrucomicrobiota bacterium]